MAKQSRQSDEALMQLLRNGELNAAAQLFERYHVRLYNFFLRLIGEQVTSEDLTQNVFERMIKYRKSYVAGMPFKAWIYQIARNVKSDHFRSKKVLVTKLADPVTVAGEEDSIIEKIKNREQLNSLQQAMRALNPEQREILELTRFQKMKYQEVAHLLGCTEGAVKVKVHRAIQQLRKQFFKIENT